MVSNFLMWVVQVCQEYLIPVAKVVEGNRGARFTFGRVHKRDLGPGIYMYVPYIQDIRITASCYQEVDTLVQFLTTKDGVIIALSANVGYEVVDAAKWWTKVYNFDTTVERAIRKILFRISRALEYHEFLESLDGITDVVSKQIQKKVRPWGVKIVEVELTDFAKTKVWRLLNETNSFAFTAAGA